MKTKQLWIFLSLMLGATLLSNAVQQVWGYPEQFAYGFSGTGVVETLEHKGSRCLAKIALYDWLNLSSSFPQEKLPGRNSRFYVTGNQEACNAISVASASTGKHLAFDIGLTKNKWYFSSAPMAGSGCGGLELDWQPEPEL